MTVILKNKIQNKNDNNNSNSLFSVFYVMQGMCAYVYVGVCVGVMYVVQS